MTCPLFYSDSVKMASRLRFLARLLVLAAFFVPGFRVLAEEPKPYQAQDGWRMLQRALPFATNGNRSAIHDCFMASYLRVSSPFLGGEDCEAIASGLSEILYRIGDGNFSRALSIERPEIIAAVKFWIRSAPGFDAPGGKGYKKLQIDDYPRTTMLLDSVQDVDFPLREESPRRVPLLKQLSR